jgi:hypothetical protein
MEYFLYTMHVFIRHLRYLVQVYPESLQVTTSDGELALHLACSKGAELDILRYLVQEYPESLQVTDNEGYLTLHCACIYGVPLDVVRYLVHEYPESLHATDTDGDLPPHLACSLGTPLDIVQYLVQEYPESLQVTNNDGNLPSHRACHRHAPLDVVLYLVQEYHESLQCFIPLTSTLPSRRSRRRSLTFKSLMTLIWTCPTASRRKSRISLPQGEKADLSKLLPQGHCERCHWPKKESRHAGG